MFLRFYLFFFLFFFFLMIRRPPRSTPLYSSAASDVYKRQVHGNPVGLVSGPAPGAVEHDDLRGQVPRPEHRHSHDPALEPFTRTGLGRERLARNGSAPARRCRTGLVTTGPVSSTH